MRYRTCETAFKVTCISGILEIFLVVFLPFLHMLLFCRHQLLPDDDLGPLYDLLIDEPADIRHAIGALVYDHLIAQKFNSSQTGSKGMHVPFAH